MDPNYTNWCCKLWKENIAERKKFFSINIYYLLFTMQNCPLFDPSKDEWRKFAAEHPDLFFEIMLPAKKEIKCIQLIEKYYGVLDYGMDEIALKNTNEEDLLK